MTVYTATFFLSFLKNSRQHKKENFSFLSLKNIKSNNNGIKTLVCGGGEAAEFISFHTP
jgi:hypothetical protein